MSSDRPALVAAVVRVLDDTEREYAQMPFFVRPMVRRGLEKRTGHDVAGCTGLPLDLTLALAPDPLLEAVVASIWPFTIS